MFEKLREGKPGEALRKLQPKPGKLKGRGFWKSKKVIAIMLVILLCGSIITVRTINKAREAATAFTTDSVTVAVADVVLGEVASGFTASGVITGEQEVSIVAKASGQVMAVPVNVGDRVAAGQVIVQLDPAEAEAAYQQALAALQTARANTATETIPGSGESLSQAEAARQEAEIAYRNAQANYDRMQQLYNAGAISRQQLEQAEYALTQARKAYIAGAQGPAVAAAQLAQAEAGLAAAQARLDNVIIKSPIDGVIGLRNINPGDTANPGVTLLTVVSMDKVKIKVNVTEANVTQLKPNQEVRVRVDSLPGQVFKGTIATVAPAANPQNRLFPVEVVIDNQAHQLKPGMFAEIMFVTQKMSNVPTIPVEAVVPRGDAKVVYVVNGDTVEERTVLTAIDDGKRIVVTQGVQPGEIVVTSGQQLIKNGSKVRAQRGEQS